MFAVHARNLHDFLTNSEGSRNFNAQDFVAQFRVAKVDETKGMFQKLHAQVFHLGKSRPTDQQEKANLDSAKSVSSWIETNFATFVSELEKGGRKWDWHSADPSKIARDGTVVVHTSTASVATNSIVVAVTDEHRVR